jgi:thiamine monophosphate kinase
VGDAVGLPAEDTREHQRVAVVGRDLGIEPAAARRQAGTASGEHVCFTGRIGDEHAARHLRRGLLVRTCGPCGREHLVEHKGDAMGLAAARHRPKG